MGKKRISIRIAFLAILLILFITSSVSYIYMLREHDGDVYLSTMANGNETTENIQKDDTKELATKRILELQEYYNNDDIKGELIIEGTDIKEPILKYSDNSYYLNHNNYGEYQAEGSVYQDYRMNLGDKKVLIFGHSSPNWNVPFNELEKYYDKSFYDDHKYIKIIRENKIDEYEIFSVYVETKDFSYMNLKINDETYNQYLKNYKDNSLYDTGVEITDNDEIVILQTCSNNSKYSNYKKKYLLVIGRKINKEEER